MVTNYEGEAIEFKENLPLLPVRDLVVYPFMILPLFVGRETSIKAVEEALNNTDRLILLASQKDITAESPTPSEIYEMGTVAMIMRMRKLPDGRIKILIQGLAKARIKDFVSTEPFYQVKVEKVEVQPVTASQPTIEALARTVKENLEKVISFGKVLSPDILMVLEDTQDPNAAVSAAGSTTTAVPTKDLEVAMGIDVIEKTDFDFSTKIFIGNEGLLKILAVPGKRELVFKGLKPGRTSVTVRDTVGDVRLQYTVTITATGKSNTVSELRELIGDVEGLEIGIRGGKVFVGGEIVVPDDIGRVSQVLASYPDVLTLIELSPQTQRVIARKMTDELAKNNLKDVTVRVVNKVYWLEGVVSSEAKKVLAQTIAKAYLPPRIMNLSAASNRYETANKDDILNFIAVNEKKEPAPTPKMIKITSQFVELSKSYNKVFAFKWAPLMGEDNSRISFGQTADGNLTGQQSEGTLSATISNLFPKLNAAKSAGYARTIQSGMVIVRDGFEQGGKISKKTTIPYALGTGDFTKASNAEIGLDLDVKPKILEQEKLELGIVLSVSIQVPSGSAAPVTTNNAINTNVVLKSKESAAIGGIVQNTSTTDYDNTGNDPAPQTATAGAAPATPLFRLYRSKSYSTNKSQYVIFVTPEIIESASAGTEEIRKKFRRRE